MKNQVNDYPDIIYTKVDEAPELASASLLPIIKTFLNHANISVGVKDISLAGRIIANFPQKLDDSQIQPDDLADLGELVNHHTANIIKLPNISASVPQLKEAIKELQEKGYSIPPYPEHPKTDEEEAIKATYGKILGSAVNPVLREGNSDRRAPISVKAHAKKNPHKMGEWHPNSKTHVSTMNNGDFYSNEKSITITDSSAGNAMIKFIHEDGRSEVLAADQKFEEGDIIDGTMMSVQKLRSFIKNEIEDAKTQGILFSLHVKATMMKVSDPIIFGHVVSVYLNDVFEKHKDTFSKLSVNPDLGIGDLLSKIKILPADEKIIIESDIKACLGSQPDLYMVNSDQGITNLHSPNDVIIDASLPALIRAGGRAWGPDGKEHDAKCVIPDSSYAGVYEEAIDFCKRNGAFDPSEMGSVSNVGLMARKAEEYGSHPQTFKAVVRGKIQIVDANSSVLIEHTVEKGDIWRMCQTKDIAISNWIELGMERAHLSGQQGIFWLSEERAHDFELIKKVNNYLGANNKHGVNLPIMSPIDATRFSLEEIKKGHNIISITGNVLRDYLTDLFPILEVGTSAKMLSIVPLLNGGGLFETGAGGSAPKHVQQLLEEGHLRWDSLGEFCALSASLDFLGQKKRNSKATILSRTLDDAIENLLDNNKSPSRKVGEIDNRGSHYYIAKYWASALSEQDDDAELKALFHPIADKLNSEQDTIENELLSAQGSAVDLGGYYHTLNTNVRTAMRPSLTLNDIIG